MSTEPLQHATGQGVNRAGGKNEIDLDPKNSFSPAAISPDEFSSSTPDIRDIMTPQGKKLYTVTWRTKDCPSLTINYVPTVIHHNLGFLKETHKCGGAGPVLHCCIINGSAILFNHPVIRDFQDTVQLFYAPGSTGSPQEISTRQDIESRIPIQINRQKLDDKQRIYTTESVKRFVHAQAELITRKAIEDYLILAICTFLSRQPNEVIPAIHRKEMIHAVDSYLQQLALKTIRVKRALEERSLQIPSIGDARYSSSLVEKLLEDGEGEGSL